MNINPYAISRFKGKTALITGGAAGMGRATAQRLASEGAHVIVADCDVDGGQLEIELIQRAGGSGVFQEVDLAVAGSIKALGEAVARQVDGLHVLVNCAGIGEIGGSVEKDGATGWDQLMSINLKASPLVAQVVLPLMKQSGGAIVNVTSDGAFRGRAGSWIYDATKAGLWSVTKSMACEFNRYGIRVNNVAPGWSATEFHFATHADPDARRRELENLDTDYCLMRRLGRPEEIAAAIAFLASDEASFITGATLCVDGGRVGLDLP